jgi:hypothetical protein
MTEPRDTFSFDALPDETEAEDTPAVVAPADTDDGREQEVGGEG